MCVESFIIKTYQIHYHRSLWKLVFKVNHNILGKVCVIQVCVTTKKEFNGSRYFLWTCSGLLRDNVDHSPSKKRWNNKLQREPKRSGEKTWVEEWSKPYRNRPLLACCRSPYTIPRLLLLNATSRFSGPSLFKRMARARSRHSFATSTFSGARFFRRVASVQSWHSSTRYRSQGYVMHSTQIIVTNCHVNMLRSELFQTNGQSTFMILLTLAGRQGHKQ